MTEWKRQVGDETIYRTCAWSPPGCHPVGCGLLVHVKEGVVTKIEGDPEHPITKGALCPRCLALKDYMYHPDRIIYPMKRAKEDRGKDKFERCSWDEALDIIETNAKKIMKDYGGEAITVFGGTGREGNNYYATLANCVFGSPNSCYAQPGWSCYGPRAAETAFMMGGGYPEIDYAQKFIDRYDHPGWVPPKVIVLWGKEPLRSNPDGLFGHAIVEMMQKFGTKVIMVDPQVRWLGTRSEYVLQVRPGTDTAMAMAWINVIVEEDLYDHDFVDKWTYGFDQLAERCREEMPVSKAAEICGVPEEDIRGAARLYATSHPSSLAWGLAVDQNPNGAQLAQCLIALMCITGDLEAPGGTTLGSGDPHASNAGRNDDVGGSEDRAAEEAAKRMEEEEYSVQMETAITIAYKYGMITKETYAKRIGVDMYPAVGAVCWTVMPDEFLKTLETDKPYKMHMAMFSSSNPVGSAISGEPQRWFNALKKLDFNFATDLFMNATIMSCCDVVLPLETTVEHDQVVVTHYALNTSFYGAEQKCVQVGECKSDVETMIALGQRMFPDYWNQFKCEDDYVRSTTRGELNWDRIHKDVVVMTEEPYYKYKTGLLRADHQVGFPTQTGRLELYAYTYSALGEDPLPYFEPPAFGPEATPELMKDYPFVLTTGARHQAFFHSEHKQIKSLRSLNPDPLVDINTEDAAELGIKEGDWVELASPYGKCRDRVRVTPTIKKGIVHAQHGWVYPEEEHAEPNLMGNWKSNINMLMPNSVTGKLGFGDTFKCMICSIKKVDGHDFDNTPSADNVYVEPSRQEVFKFQQTWRPATAPEYSDN